MNKRKHLTKIISLIFALVMLSSVMIISASAASAPKAPEKVSATQTTSSITLSWSKVSGATGYRIYYKFPRDLHWKTAVSSITATSKTWNNLPSGETYIFAVKSYTKSGNTTTWGGYTEFTTATKTSAPKKVTASQTESSIKLNWSEVKGATGYRVHYKTSATAKWKTATSSVKDDTVTYSNLASAKKYTFAVQPYIKTSSGVIWGAYKEIGTATKPATPKSLNLECDPYNKTATLSWSKVSGADGYRIYQREYGEEAWKVAVNSTSKTSYTLKNLPDNQYEFAVMALVKTTSGNICGYYRWTKGNFYSPTTAPPITLPTTTRPTTTKISYTTEINPATTETTTSITCTTAHNYPSVEEPSAYNPTAVIVSYPKNSDVVIKSSPSSLGEPIAVHPKGYPLYIIARQDGYYYVDSPALGHLLGWVDEYSVDDYTTAPAATENTTNIAPTTAALRTAVSVAINEVGVDSQGRVYAAINSDGWDGAIKSNSQRVTVYVDGVEMDKQATLQISSSTTSDGYQYVYIDLGKYDIDPSNCTITFEIPEGFLENRNGTKYNLSCEVTV